MNDKKRKFLGVDPADPTTESISGITLPTRGSHATNPFQNQKPDEADKLFVTEGNQVIQQKSGLNFFVFSKREIHSTERLVEDRYLATVLADKLEERRELRKLVDDLIPYVYHKAICDAHTPARGPCNCQIHEIIARINDAIGTRDEHDG